MYRKFFLIGTCVSTLFVAGCADDDPVAPVPIDAPGEFTISLQLEQLEPLTEGSYEGWLIFGDEKVSTGVFTDPTAVALTTDRDPAGADAFVVTIEPSPDDDPAPSGVVVLTGDVVNGVVGELAFPVDFGSAEGGFILRTPTDDPAPSFELTLDLSGLEALTAGAYEGWLIYGEEKVSTGTFTEVTNVVMTTDRDPAGADAFVVTIEPSPDDDPEPSGVVVLTGDITDVGGSTALSFPADLGDGSGGFILRTPTDDDPATYRLDVALDGLEDLTEGVYEGWLIVGDAKISTGTFTSGDQANLYTQQNPADADAFVVTIEPVPDADPEPSGIVVLEGTLNPDGATALSFPVDLTGAGGGFFFRTPTDDAVNTTNDEAGVWFINNTGPMMEPGLNLPALPSGWVYEGWAVTQGQPLTTGRFVDVAAADLASPYSEGGPPFPGEDFVMNLPSTVTPPVDLTDGASTIVISVEPDLSGVDPTGAGPFAVKPLALPIPMNHPTGTFTSLAPGPVVNVTGSMNFALVTNDEAGVWFLEMTADGPVAGLELPELPDGWVYEGWAVTQGTPLTTGRFTDVAAADLSSPYSEGGPPFPGEDFLMDLPASVTPPVNLVDGASTIVISVEPDIGGVDPTGAGPFALKPLALPLEENHPTATFTALGEGPVVTVSGTLTVTSIASSTSNDEAGVWFLEMTPDGPVAALDLPELPAGWVYEGWAVTQGVPLSTGRFVDPMAADLASPYSQGGPPFPGEDFLMNLPAGVTPPVDLTDGASTIVISVEPDIGGVDPTGDGPFAFKPLAFAIPANHPTATFTALGDGPSLAPRGSATVMR